MFIRLCALTMKRTVLLTALLAMATSASLAAAQKRQFEVAAGSAAQTLNEFSRQANLQLLFDADAVRGFQTQAVSGEMEVADALALLLGKTNLVYEFVNERTVAVMLQGSARPRSQRTSGGGRAGEYTRLAQAESAAAAFSSEATDPSSSQRIELEEIVVTGTHIRGAQESASPLIVIDRAEIDRAGYSTTAQLIRNLPQNLDFSENIAGGLAGTSIGGATGSATVNLRGLGVGTTLTLLNGHRLAAGGLSERFVDISLIPLSAVERVEVLTDGASAIYGADAIGGVVNFILRDSFDGAETKLRYGSATEGSLQEYQASQTLGHSWSKGNLLGAYEYSHRTELDANDRSFARDAGDPSNLLPEVQRHNVLLTGRQAVTESLELFGDFSYSSNESESFVTQDQSSLLTSHEVSDSGQYGATLGGRLDLWSDWQAQLVSGYSSNDTTQEFSFPNLAFVATAEAEFELRYGEVIADGTLFQSSGGAARLAVGGQFRSEDFQQVFVEANQRRKLRRDVSALFGELLVPLVGESNRRPGVYALELSAAGRFDDYSDFGSTLNPKVGLRFAPIRQVSLRGTYGTSFRAPALLDLGGSNSATAFPGARFDPPPGQTSAPAVIILSGANPDLDSEESATWTAGFDLRPIAGFDVSVTYFDTTYDRRIGNPSATFRRIVADPGRLGEFLILNPSAEQVNAIYGLPYFQNPNAVPPSAVGAIADIRKHNLAYTKVRGVDLSSSYSTAAQFGELSFALAGSYLFEYKRRSTPTTPTVDIVDTLANPIDLKLHGHFGWNRGAYGAALYVNYVDGYASTATGTSVAVDSWTTLDLNLSYQTRPESKAALLRDVRIALSIQNVLDEAPPHVDRASGDGVFYDGVNASALGRFVALQLQKVF